MAEGIDPAPQTLRSPAALLELKICDPACGSGASLVQVCRYLADKLLEAWQRLETEHPGQYIITPEGQLAAVRPENCPIPVGDEERRIVARRLVADRCIYGVDKNPLAVEMAKLSLWLVTLQKNQPFTFLDHAIRCGDALIGIASLDELDWFYQDTSGQQRLMTSNRERLQIAREKRLELEAIPDTDLDRIQSKARLLEEAEIELWQLRLLADVTIGGRLEYHVSPSKLDDMLQAAAMQDIGALENRARETLGERRRFHWSLEFPEVFDE